MSLANVLAVSQAAKTVVLLGDPQQLDQPMQGSHPEGTDVSALDHILGGRTRTIARTEGCSSKKPGGCIRPSAPSPPSCSMTASSAQRMALSSRSSRDQGRSAGPACASCPSRITATRTARPKRRKQSARLWRRSLESNATWVDRDGEGEAAHARRHHHHHALQRAGLRDSAVPAGSARRHGGQVSGPGSADRDLFDGDLKPCRRAARDGISLQPQPAQRRDIPRQVRVHPRRLAADVRSGVPHAAPNSTGKCVLPISGDGGRASIAPVTDPRRC